MVRGGDAVYTLFGYIIIFIVIPLLIYHFLIFPNFDGVMQDLRWYNYDDESQHYLYWSVFWVIAIVGGFLSSKK